MRNKIKNVEEALQLFEEQITISGTAQDADDYKLHNKCKVTIDKCIIFLYEQGQLEALHKFLTHGNYYVRLTTAYVLLPLYENESKKVLYEIAKGNYGLSKLSAEMILKQWATGKLVFPYQSNYGKRSSPKKEEKSSSKVSNKSEEHGKSGDFSPETLLLSKIFDCPPTDDNNLCNEQVGFYVSFDPEKQEIEIRVNTFVNPYTQDVKTVYQERVERFKAFEQVATIEANKPSKLGFMQIVLTIPKEKATDDVLLKIKDVIYAIYRQWKPNESLVWFKVNYHKGISYFEGSWWYPRRAIIMNGRGYERYDFSDEMKFDEEMWEIVQGEFDEFENSDSFALIDGKYFQEMWESTELNYKPKPY